MLAGAVVVESFPGEEEEEEEEKEWGTDMDGL